MLFWIGLAVGMVLGVVVARVWGDRRHAEQKRDARGRFVANDSAVPVKDVVADAPALTVLAAKTAPESRPDSKDWGAIQREHLKQQDKEK